MLQKIFSIIADSKKAIVASGVLVFGVVWAATTFGPFHISDVASPEYNRMTFAEDQEINFPGAEALAAIYLPALLNSPAAMAKNVGHSYFRVIYWDGQIADFKIARFPSGAPLEFSQKVSSATQQHLSDQDRADAVNSAPCGALTVSIPTGYFGSFFVPGEMITIGSWVDTGFMTINVGLARRNCR